MRLLLEPDRLAGSAPASPDDTHRLRERSNTACSDLVSPSLQEVASAGQGPRTLSYQVPARSDAYLQGPGRQVRGGHNR